MRWKKGLKGSYTVEAAFLIPMAFGLVLFLISCAWFLHDRVSACAWVHETAVWEGFQKRGEGSRESPVKVLITKAEELVEQRGKEVTVVCQGNEWFLPSFVKNLFVLGRFHVEESEHIRRVYGEEAVRLRGFLEGAYERWK
ncbi:MAG: hypothetical protein HFI67_00810 [Lachnospiraceae bacterium]|jgi:hypothetical protein|nr:hypothetical protein [Lachnospiraceae bacterium]